MTKLGVSWLWRGVMLPLFVALLSVGVPYAYAGDVHVQFVVIEGHSVVSNQGESYPSWTYNGTIPGPVVRATVGDTIHVSFTNPKKNRQSHSVDFSAAEVDLFNEFATIRPGHVKRFSFVARRPGVFMYHCGATPMVQHVARGMFGIMIVAPKAYTDDYPRPDREYVLVQSQLFPDAKNYQAMIRNSGWSRSLINGRAFKYDPLHDSDARRVLMAKPGERVRIYFLNANINMPVAFHVAGGIWDRVFLNGNPVNVRYDIQTAQVGVAEAAALDIVTPAGHASNMLLTDANADAGQRGASTLLISDPEADPKYGKGSNIIIR